MDMSSGAERETRKYFPSIYWKKMYLHAIKDGDIEYLRNISSPDIEDWFLFKAMLAASNLGRLEIVRFFRSMGVPCNELTTRSAALGGHISILQELRSSPPCPWDFSTSLAAIESGSLDTFKYVFNAGAPCDIRTMNYAVQKGNLEIIALLKNNQIPGDATTAEIAAACGYLDILQKFLYGMWDVRAVHAASEFGEEDCLRFLLEEGCPWNIFAAVAAAEYGHKRCLEILHQHGCNFSELVMRGAVEGGQFKILNYLFFKNCPYDDEVLKISTSPHFISHSRFSHESRDPEWNRTETIEKIKQGRKMCLKFLQNYQKWAVVNPLLLNNSYMR